MPKVVPEYKEEAKSRIIEAASKVFAEKGYHEATMDDVAKRVGVSKGALYLYFSSKEELFEAMFSNAPQEFKGILLSSFGNNADPIQGANRFFDKMLEAYGSNPGLSFEILSEASHNPALRKILKKNQEEYANVTATFLEEGRKLSLVRDDLDLHSMAYGLVALWNGMETLLVSGLPATEAKRAWQVALRAVFEPWHKDAKTQRAPKQVATA